MDAKPGTEQTPQSPILRRIVEQSGFDELFELLAERLAPTDLQSLLLEVYRRRAAAVTPQRLLQQYQSNKLVRPATVSPAAIRELELLAFGLAARFEPLELSPVCPLGTNSAVATVDQNQTLATVRNIELVSDLTNVLALECAVRRRAALRDKPAAQHLRLCAAHRVLRPQTHAGPAMFAHFGLFGLCSAGRDSGEWGFETAELLEQLPVYLELLRHSRFADKIGGVRVALTLLPGGPGREQVEQQVYTPLAARWSDVDFGFDQQRTRGLGYYSGVCFDIGALDKQGSVHSLVDGGFTDWTQQLVSSRKERLLISGIGTERLATLFESGS